MISPWNFPLLLAVGDAIPALAAGAAVVIKPSEFTPLSLLELVRGWTDEVGGPGVIEVATGLGETGSALVDEADLRPLHRIGRHGEEGDGSGRRDADAGEPRAGGKDPLIVLDDADPERAANGAAWGGLANSGQICESVERVYATEPVYDQFLEALTESVSRPAPGADRPAYARGRRDDHARPDRDRRGPRR